MKCIFCQYEADNSKSIEHIIPESLGNTEHILPAGVVCDDCNQYFGSKVEKLLLESDYFRQARFRMETPNKAGRIPSISAFLLPRLMELEWFFEKDGSLSVAPRNEKDCENLADYLLAHKRGKMIIVEAQPPDEKLISRFLGKVAIEVMAHRLLDQQGGLEFVSTDPQLDPLRKYVRFGEGPALWPFFSRRIYPEDKIFTDNIGRSYEVLHEYALLYTQQQELYLVLAIYGVEYTINLGSPTLEGYETWLRENAGKSYLDMLEAS
jgi:hypothetical protein